MKKLFITLAIAMLVGRMCQAQWIVYDPVSNIQQILDQVESMAEYAEMVDNQVQQIDQLTAQLQQLQQYNQAFGNPAQIVNVAGVSVVTSDLTRTPLGLTISTVEQSANGVAALTYDANGLYNEIGATFTTPSENQIQRSPADYKSYEAINNATANYTNVTADVLQRRQALKNAIASTTEAVQSATTTSQVQKLIGVLIGQQAALAATDKEVDQAVDVSVEQDIENRNDLRKQATAEQEEQKAEMVETFDNYRTNFSLSTNPPIFPTDSQ